MNIFSRLIAGIRLPASQENFGFVDTNTVDGTVRNLQRWLALGAGDYAAMSERARQCFATRFHMQRAAEGLVEIIGEHGR